LKLQYFLLIFTLIFISSCGNESPQVDPNISALPHSDALPSKALSQKDQAKLLNAKGKTTELIKQGDLLKMLTSAENKLYIFAFWKMDCEGCLTNLQNLSKIQFLESEAKVISINLDDKDALKEVTLFTRSNNIPFENYLLNIEDKNFFQTFAESWDGNLPAIFLVNQSEEVFLKYYKALSENELEAITSALII